MLGQIEAFIAVARAGTLRKAAITLCLSEPAVSARIASLEADLGIQLFDRGRRGMSLTVAGQAFLAHAVRAVDAVDSGRRSIADILQGRDGEVVIGAASSIASYVIPDVVTRFQQLYPQVRVVVRTRPSGALVDLVARGDIQIGLVGELLDDRVRQTGLYDEELLLVAGAGAVPEELRSMALADLRERTVILFDRGCAYDDVARGLLRAAGVTPRAVIEVDSIETARALVARKAGVSLMPATAVVRSIARGELDQIAVRDQPPARVRVVAIEPLTGPPWAPVATIRELLRTETRNRMGMLAATL